jgi:hypothetical protein
VRIGQYIRGQFKKYLTRFFSAETNEAREVCCGMKVQDTFMRLRGFFSRQQTASVACSQRVSIYTARVAFFIFCENDVTTRTAVLHQILPEAWRWPSRNHSEDLVGF